MDRKQKKGRTSFLFLLIALFFLYVYSGLVSQIVSVCIYASAQLVKKNGKCKLHIKFCKDVSCICQKKKTLRSPSKRNSLNWSSEAKLILA